MALQEGQHNNKVEFLLSSQVSVSANIKHNIYLVIIYKVKWLLILKLSLNPRGTAS